MEAIVVYKSIAASGKEASMASNIRAVICAVVFAALFIASHPAQAQVDSPQATLNQYISDLQKNPDNNVLREKIIKHVQTMRPAPTIPEEAKKYINRGIAAAEDAKSEKDYKDAADEFQKAVNLAPWLGSGYRGLAVTQDKAGQYSQALQNLNFFLLTNPPPAEAEAAKTLGDKIEYRIEKAAKESSPAVIAEKRQAPFEALLEKIDGRRYTSPPDEGYTAVIDVRGKVLVCGMINKHGLYSEINTISGGGRVEIHGSETTVPLDLPPSMGFQTNTYIISEDGDRITVRRKFGDGEVRKSIYLWQR